MCFNVDYDWTAEISEESTTTAEKPWTCDECFRKFPVGTTRHVVYQQEWEECQACANGECECKHADPDDPIDCQCAEPSYGETFDYQRCDECNKFLAAVEQAELDAGCPPGESLPPYCGMTEYIGNSGIDEAKKYFVKALRMHPELKASGYLTMIYGKMF